MWLYSFLVACVYISSYAYYDSKPMSMSMICLNNLLSHTVNLTACHSGVTYAGTIL